MKRFILYNALVALPFYGLWIWQYHMSSDLCDRIDDFAPWAWFVAFWVASLFAFYKRFQKKAVLVSFGGAAACWCAFNVLLVLSWPIFDPWW
jgi:hypothetical protein